MKHSIYDDDVSSSDESYSSDTNSDYSLKSMSPVTSEEEYVTSSSSNESDCDTSETQTPTMSSAIQPSTASLQSPGSFLLTTNQQVSTQCAGEPFSHGKTMYRLCGDNIDKTVKPRYMRSDTHKTESIHYFHSYAIANRVDFSDLSERYCYTNVTSIHVSDVLRHCL